MAETFDISIDPDEIENLLLIVVGAHLRAEVGDRPLAYQLCDRIGNWIDQNESTLNVEFVPVVCCDILYVNQPPLQARPTISVGGPGVNALRAYWWSQDKLTPALVSDDRYVVQLDPEFVDLRACVWGMDHELTVEVIELFCERYLDGYLKAVATQVEPDLD